MNLFSAISGLYRYLFRRHRLVVQDETDNSEQWHMHISLARIFAAMLAFVLLMFVLILSMVAYTPVLEFLPGYKANTSRELLLHNISRLDSISQQLRLMRDYSDNVALIMEGKTPVVRNIMKQDSGKVDKTLVPTNREDSLLRRQMQGEGPYQLGQSSSRPVVNNAMAPAKGTIIAKFDPKQGQYGVRIATSSADVFAIDSGTVILSLWSADDEGYVVQIQHADNRLSVYRNLSQSLVNQGQHIDGGAVIGYSGKSQEIDQIIFELWDDGNPVDPESHILFR
jgi:murein DD-endopeptidase MepM/ murein hydrolase activator NlpD